VVKYIKVKSLDIYIRYHHLQGNPDQERFTVRSDVLTGNDTRRRSAISGSPLPERTDFAARQTHLCPSQLHYGLHIPFKAT